MRRSIGLAAAALAVTALALTALGGGAPRAAKPHFVLFLADDLGWNDVGWHGSEIATPTLDRLAAAGVRLERFYVDQTCTPTRAALLTGRYPFRYGLQAAALRPWDRYGLPGHEKTIAEQLRAAGYRTALVGKWHLGVARAEFLPTRRGFDHHYGSYLGNIDHFSHRQPLGGLDWHRDGQAAREAGYSTTLLAREAVRLIEAHDPSVPLFLLVAFDVPHAPVQAPPEAIARYAALPPDRRVYAAMVTLLDQAVGEVHAALERRGMLEHTLVWFASDNGAVERGGGSNRPLRSGKSSLYEGGLRVPAFANWPGRLPGGRSLDAPIHVVDVAPTLLALAGLAPDPGRRVDGRDVWPMLAGGQAPAHSELVLHIEPNRGALLVDGWKLVLNGERPPEGQGGAHPDRRTVELFQVAQDPEEKHDLARAQPERRAELQKRLDEYGVLAAPALGSYLRDPSPGFEPPEVWGEGPYPVGRVR